MRVPGDSGRFAELSMRASRLFETTSELSVRVCEDSDRLADLSETMFEHSVRIAEVSARMTRLRETTSELSVRVCEDSDRLADLSETMLEDSLRIAELFARRSRNRGGQRRPAIPTANPVVDTKARGGRRAPRGSLRVQVSVTRASPAGALGPDGGCPALVHSSAKVRPGGRQGAKATQPSVYVPKAEGDPPSGQIGSPASPTFNRSSLASWTSPR